MSEITEKQTKKRHAPEKPVRLRHKIVVDLIRFPFAVAGRLLYGFRREKIDIPSPDGIPQQKRQMLVLYNHQTPFDQFFVGLTFRRPIYYLASEDIFSNGWISRLLKWAVNPIPIDKSKTDVHAIGTLSRVCRDGGSIAIAPEGNRTYSGQTGYMKPSIVPLCRKFHLPIAFFRIEGGYAVHPRFSDRRRKGSVRARVASILEPEVYDRMTDAELYRAIVEALAVCEPNENTPIRGDHLAEYLERAIYYCPKCGFTRLMSRENTTTCTTCGTAVTLHEDGSLTEGEKPFVFPNILSWYRAEEKYLSSLGREAFSEVGIEPDRVALFRVELCKRKVPVDREATLALFSDRIELTANGTTETYGFETAGVRSFSILGRNKLNFRVKRENGEPVLWQCRGDEHFNALKYLHFFTHAQNLRAAEQGGQKEDLTVDQCEFLGL